MISTVIFAFVSLFANPAYAEDTAEVLTTSISTTGVINIQHFIANENQGDKTEYDFAFTLKHLGENVAGSPFIVTGESGVFFTLEPGIYTVSMDPVDGYLGTWSGDYSANGILNLKAGQVMKMARYSFDFGYAAIGETSTEDGGLLPATSTSWFNFLTLGLLLSAAGAFGFRKFSLAK